MTFILYYILIISTLLTQETRQQPGALPVLLIRTNRADALSATPFILFKSSLTFFLSCINSYFPEHWNNWTRMFIPCSLSHVVSAVPIYKVIVLTIFLGLHSGLHISLQLYLRLSGFLPWTLNVFGFVLPAPLNSIGISPLTRGMQSQNWKTCDTDAAASDGHPRAAQAQGVPEGRSSLLLV